MTEFEHTEEAVQEIETFASELGEWARSRKPKHAVTVPFALARILLEVVLHDGGNLRDCLALVRAAAGPRG